MNAQAPPFVMTRSPAPPSTSDSSPPSPTSSPPQTPTTTAVAPDDATSAQKQPQVVRILRREHKRPNNNRSALADSNGEILDPFDQRKNMTIEERELAYGLARARIFAEEAAAESPRSNSSSPKPTSEETSGESKPEGSPSSSPSSSTSASASSSTSGPPKAAVNGKPKQKNPSTSTQPNGDAAPRAPRVIHKPKPQFRPPASANFAVASPQFFGYPGFVPGMQMQPSLPPQNHIDQFYGLAPPGPPQMHPQAPPPQLGPLPTATPQSYGFNHQQQRFPPPPPPPQLQQGTRFTPQQLALLHHHQQQQQQQQQYHLHQQHAQAPPPPSHHLQQHPQYVVPPHPAAYLKNDAMLSASMPGYGGFVPSLVQAATNLAGQQHPPQPQQYLPVDEFDGRGFSGLGKREGNDYRAPGY